MRTKTKLNKLLSLLLCFVMVAGMLPAMTFPVSAAGTDETTPPAVSKTLTPNSDGTYTLSLSVTGAASSVSESSKADVIVVLDTSGSMNDEVVTYQEYPTGRYGLVNGNYVGLYYYQGRYRELTNDNYTGTVYYRTGSWPSYDYTEYNGTRYIRQTSTRLNIAKTTINSLAEQLLDYNTADDPDKVNLSLVTFANLAVTRVTGTDDIDTFRNAVNNLTASGGTNWEDALHDANAIATREGADVYIIFVSDGNPTFRNTQGGDDGTSEDDRHGTSPNFYYGSGNSDNNGKNYQWALVEATAIVNAGKELFCIGVFGNVTNMENLAVQSGAGIENYYSADDYDAITEAFSNIISQITNAFGYKDIAFNDSITGMTSTFVEADPTTFTYTRSGGDYGAGTPWIGAPSAVYNEGQVTWNLGDMQLENGVTYTVSFKVWPSQDAYDLVADLNNGLENYDDLTEEQKAQIVPLAGGGYGLNTNLDASLGYTQIETRTTNVEPEGYIPGEPADDGYTYTYDPDTGIYTGIKETPGTVDIDNPDPIELPDSAITVEKSWNDTLDLTLRPDSITFEVKKDGEYYMDVVLNEVNSWTQQIHAAPGVIAGGVTLEEGHDYSVTEPEIGDQYEIESNVFHPMLVDGTMTPENGSLTITNNLKGRLSIAKTVTAEEGDTPPADAEFRIKVTFIKDGTSWDGASNGATYSIGGTTPPAPMPADGIITLKAGETAIIYNIETGVEYTVEELTADIPAEFEFVPGSSTGLTGTIAANTMHQATITNHYNKLESGLVLKKIFGGDPLTEDQKNAITFTVTGPEGFTQQIISYGDFTDGTYDLGLVTPGEYTIKESSADFGGYERTTVIDVGDEEPLRKSRDGSDPDTAKFSVTDGKTRTVTFTNTYDKQSADLTITKVFDGDTNELTDEYKNAISFTVTGPNGTQTVTYGNFTAGSYTFTDLPLGEYTVSETNVALAGYDVQTTYSPEGGKITLEDDIPGTVTVTNTYNKLAANLTITKEFNGDTSELNADYMNGISFDVESTAVGFVALNLPYSSFTQYEGYIQKVLIDVPPGTYTVKENLPAPPDRHIVDTTYNPAAGGQITLEDGESKELIITNTYDKQSASLTITKNFIGDTAEPFASYSDEIKGITFTVEGENGYEKTVTYGEFTAGSYTFGDLPPDVYTVTESLYNNIPGYEVTTSIPYGVEVTLNDDDTDIVTVTNTYNKLKGNLTITKVFAGITGELTDEYKDGITFNVTGPNGYEKTLTYAEFGGSDSYTIQDLPLGEYNVGETGAGLDGYNVQTSYSPSSTIELKVDEQTETVTITNTYLAGGLVLIKSFTGDPLTDTQKAGITFTITGPEGFTQQIISYGDFTDGSYDLGYVPPGEYTIVESNADFPGYIRTTTHKIGEEQPLMGIMGFSGITASGDYTVSNIIITDGYSRSVEIINDYDKQSADLTIIKNFTGDTNELTVAYKDAISFTVTGPNEFSHTVLYSQFENSQYKLPYDLPLGIYTVTETLPTAPEGYIVTQSYNPFGGTITLYDDDNGIVTVTNDYDKQSASLTIKKSFTGDTNELTDGYKNAISFTVTGPNEFSHTVLYSQFENGQYKLPYDLPLGTYTVTETLPPDPEGYAVTQSYNPFGGTITLEDDENGEVTVTNDYNKLEGSLVLQKSFTGDALTAEQKNGVTFTVYNSLGEELKVISYGEFQNGRYALNNLSLGVYSVVESNADFEGYIRSSEFETGIQPLSQIEPPVMSERAPLPADNKVEIEITDGNAHHVHFINDYERTEAYFEVPFTKTVRLGGNASPGVQTFELDVFGFGAGVDYQDVFRYAAVVTNGVGNYNGRLIISGYSSQVWEIISDGFYVREKNTGAPNWKYSEAVWFVRPELAFDSQTRLAIYPVNVILTDNGYSYVPDFNSPADRMTFVNTYTYNQFHDIPIIVDSWTLTLTKVDSVDTTYKLYGAKFDLYWEGPISDVKIGSYTTDRSGIIRAVVSAFGDYYWVETQSPVGYTLDITRQYASTRTGETNIVVKNVKTSTPPILNGEDHYAYVIGYPDGMVHPEAEITRAETATIFFRLLKEDIRIANMTRENDFTDVNPGDWYNTAISTMAALGIVKGYPDGTFGPNDSITRAEFAAIAARFDNSSHDILANFTDISGHWSEIEVSKAAANGWVSGYTDNSFKPDQNITRCEAMALVNRVLNRNPETPADLLDDMIKWPDNMDTSKWYYLDVQEATNSHDYIRKINNTERWTKINPPRDWAALEL
ncbi:MAG: DUF5979 domain-containing protein [Eubacteriales bacterium]|jgi:hypothetical protein